MKIPLISALILLIPSVHVYGACPNPDTVTTGSVGLIKVTTGFVDPCVRFDSKFNTNMQIIASTMTTALNALAAVAVDTNSLTTQINVAKNFFSTTTTRIDELQADLSTTSTDIDDFYESVNSTRTDFRVFTSTSDAQQTKFQNYSSTWDAGPGIFFSTSNLHDGNTNYIGTSVSSQTKSGGLNVVGKMVVGGGKSLSNSLAIDVLNGGVSISGNGKSLNVGTTNFTVSAGGNVGIGLNTPSSMLHIANGSITVRGAGEGLIVGATNFVVAPGGAIGIGTARPSSSLDIFNGSVTIRGGGGLAVSGGSITIDGTYISSSGFLMGGGTFTKAIVWPDGTIQATVFPGVIVEAVNSTYTAFSNYTSTADPRMNTIGVDTGTLKTEVNASTSGLSIPTVASDEGTVLSTITRLNFVGAGVTATNTGSTITVTIAGGGGLPLPNGDTTYLQLNSSQTVTGAPFIKASSMTSIGTVSSTSGFVMGGSTFTTTLSINGLTYNFPSSQGAADQVLANNGSGGLSWATDATGGGGSTQNSTFTLVLQAGGDVYKATNSFIPVPGAFGVVGKSTITIYEVQPFTNYPSTVGWTSFNVARSTIMPPSLGSPTTWQYLIQNATVGVNAMQGVWISTGFTINAGWTYALHTTSVTTNLQGAASAAEYGIKMRGWINEAHGGN